MVINNYARRSLSFGSLVALLTTIGTALTIGSSPATAVPPPIPDGPSRPSLAHTTESCGGPLAFGQVVACPSISGTEQHAYTVTTTKDSDVLFTQRTRGSGDLGGGTITGPAGQFVCGLSTDAGSCQLGAAGTYTISVSLHHGGTGDYTLSVESMRSPSSCTVLPNSFFSFANAGLTATLPFGAAAHCFRFSQPIGAVLHLADPSRFDDVQGMIRDGQYEPLCPVRSTTRCTLTTPGPYRLFLFEPFGTEVPYRLRMPRISNSAGCPRLSLARFGDPGSAVGTGTVANLHEVACHKLKPATGGQIAIRTSPEQNVAWTLFDDGGQVVCDEFLAPRSCQLPAAGDYTLVIQNTDFFDNPITYEVAAAALFRDTGCATTTGTRWDRPTIVVHQTSGVQVNCQPFRGNAGDRVIAYTAPTVFNDVAQWLVDSTGAQICTEPSEESGCVLPATGTYRVISYLRSWSDTSEDETYNLQVRRLSNPVGCQRVSPGQFGAAPTGAASTNRCRILDLPAAGVYVLKAVDAQNFQNFGQLFDESGHDVNVCGTVACTFPAPGRYTIVLESNLITETPYAIALVRVTTSSGCVAVSDTGYDGSPANGVFQSPGQYDCLQVPTPTDARLVELLPTNAAAGAGRPSVFLADSTGAFVCGSFELLQGSCPLSGTAPYLAVLSVDSGTPTGPYSMAFARVDGPPACPLLSRDTTGTATTGPDRVAACFVIPADQLAEVESFTYRRTSGGGNATLSIFDQTGRRFCRTSPSANRTFLCGLPAGPATAILETSAVDATYDLTHAARP